MRLQLSSFLHFHSWLTLLICIWIKKFVLSSLGVQNFPRKPKKAEARQESHNVIVVRRSAKDGKEEEYLVSQRPKKGKGYFLKIERKKKERKKHGKLLKLEKKHTQK